MRAVRIHETGGPEVLRVEDIELPAPGAGEVRVRPVAIGVSFIDTYHRSGLYARASLFDYVATREELELSAGRLFEVLASGAVKPVVGQRFGLDEAVACQEALEARGTVGSTLLVP